MNQRLAMAVAILGIVACTTAGRELPAPAANAATPPASDAPTAVPEQTEEVIVLVGPKSKFNCRTETPTGSHIPTRVCMTPEEWKSLRDASQDNIEALNRAPTVLFPQGGGAPGARNPGH
jgi:hypothetical protein